MSAPSLTILSLGPLNSEAVAPLGQAGFAIEVIEMEEKPGSQLSESSAALNRAFEAATHPWILMLQNGEYVSSKLAAEILHVAVETPGSWGFRLRTMPFYAGRPLLLGDVSDGEIRLIHGRRCRFAKGKAEVNVPGTVIRLEEPLRLETFSSFEEHQQFLVAHGVPHSFLRRVLLFSRNAIATGALFSSRSTLRYLWLEAGFDGQSVVRYKQRVTSNE